MDINTKTTVILDITTGRKVNIIVKDKTVRESICQTKSKKVEVMRNVSLLKTKQRKRSLINQNNT